MEQLTQNLKNGEMRILEVPYPALQKGSVLVRNHYSLISAGTESKTVKDARLNLISKANARKEEVKKVVESVKQFGLKDTYKLVMNKLDAPSPLGYSCAGEVIAVADDVSEFKIGDFVACGGNTANHAEVVSVSTNLCVAIDTAVSLKEACFTTLGAIALQGVRQADLRLGENCVVIGLGLVGQITLQLLQAAGVKAIGIDIGIKQVELAQSLGIIAFQRTQEDLEKIIRSKTNGYGTDAVIITAGTTSADPVDLAGELCRKKGKVVIVGNVSTDFKRNNYFKKELDLRMSSSYGPGRYDHQYEEKGIDYPIGYVRWTENRNMQAFVELLKEKRINLEPLISHTFDFTNATQAYQLILDKEEAYVGIVLRYNTQKELSKTVHFKKKQFTANKKVNVGLIGAGAYAQNFLLPALKGEANLIAVATSKATNARNIADKYNFFYCSGNTDELFADSSINTIFIATRHDSHASFVLKALEKGRNVYVEKPLCITVNELEQIKQSYEQSNVHLMVGFNRRFAPTVVQLKTYLKNNHEPIAINYRINAGQVAADHWTQDKQIGGGRVIGEVCHFIDLAMHIADSKVKSVSAIAMDDVKKLNDSLIIQLLFENGSIASLSYFANGSKKMSKEYVEVFSSGKIIAIDDFKSISIYGKTINNSNSKKQDKGQQAQIKAFTQAVHSGSATPIAFDEMYHSSLVTFKVLESIANQGQSILL